MKARILFVGHEASRTGAPLSLLQAQRWLAANTSWRFETLLCGDGPLADDYRAVGPVTLLPPWRAGLRQTLARVERRWMLERLRRRNTLVYANTITLGGVVRVLSRKRPVITHIRELQPVIDACGDDNLRDVLRHTTSLLACADIVQENLCRRYGLAPQRVRVVRSSVEPLRGTPQAAAVRAELGIPFRAPVIGGCGMLTPRKGPDLFIQLGQALAAVAPHLDPHLVWVGGGGEQGCDIEAMRAAVTAAGLSARVHFVGEQADVHRYFQIFDVFAMVSRSDPHPRVCLEAATLGIPSVGFDAAGGIREFIEHDAGVVVSGLDVHAMAVAVAALLDAPQRLRQMGVRAAEKVAARHDVSVIGPQVAAAIEEALASAPTSAEDRA